jgi:hypothetical protein
MPADDAAVMVLLLRGLADEERRRADRAATLAANYEARAAAGPEHLSALRTRMAGLHRRMERRHRTSAGLQEMHAVTTEAWLARGQAQPRIGASQLRTTDTVQPRIMDTVAQAIGVPSATAALHGSRRLSVAASSSDDLARTAHELELAVGEGPAGSAAGRGEPVSAGNGEMAQRWPLYGPAAVELGVRSVLAMPLRQETACLGSLVVYGTGPVLDEEVVAATDRVTGAVTEAMLLAGGSLFADADYEPMVHQAVGMVAARCRCGVEDAEDLLRARAFAEERPVAEIAQAVLRGEISLSLRAVP